MLVYFFSLKRLTPPLNVYSELERMLTLRRLNWSYGELSEEFAVPKTTIRYLIRRFGLAGRFNPPTRANHRTTRTITNTVYSSLTESKDYSQKTYADYLQDEKDRKWKRLTQSHLKP